MQGRNELGLQAFFDAIESGDLNAVLNLAESVDVNACQKKCVNSRIIDKSTVELSPLMLACRLGRLNVVKILLNLPQLKCDLQSNNGYTALHYAVFEGHLPIVKMLIAKGASVNVCDKIGRSPLLTAVTYRKEVTNALVDCLLDAGADTSLKDSNGTTASERARLLGDSRNDEAILDASTFTEMTAKLLGEMRHPSQIRSAKRYIARFPKATHTDKSFYDDALHAAVLADNAEMIDVLVAAGADVNFTVKDTPLIHLAAELNKEKSVESLIKNKATIDCGDTRLVTPLMLAVSQNNENIVRMLLAAGADVKLKSKDGYTVINCFHKEATVAIAKMLVEAGADVESYESHNALRLIVAYKNTELAHYLLSVGANPNIVGQTQSSLMRSVKCGDDSLIRHLIEKKAEVNFVMENMTALSYAVGVNNISAANILLDSGANIDLGAGREALLKSATSDEMKAVLQEAIVLKDMTSEKFAALKAPTELELAKNYITRNPKSTHANPTFYEEALLLASGTAKSSNIEIVKLLLANDVNVNYKSKDNFTPLYIAADKGNTEIAGLLIANKADVNQSCGTRLHTPLIAAASKGHPTIVKLLLDNNAGVNLADNKGAAPLHFACNKNGSEEIVNALLDRGAKLDARSPTVLSPIHCAILAGNMPLAHLLLGKGADIKYAYTDASVLSRAVEFADELLIKKIIDKGADVNLVMNNITALSEAVRLNKVNVVNILLDAGANIDLGAGREALLKSAKSDEMKSVLQEAIVLKDMTPEKFAALKSTAELESAKKYITRNPKTSHPNPTFYEEALYITSSSVQTSNIDIVKLLLTTGVNVNYKSLKNFSALYQAVLSGLNETVGLLIASGADVNLSCGRDSHTPLMAATHENNLSIVELLLDNNVDVNAVGANKTPGKTALHFACNPNGSEAIVNALLEKGANLEALVLDNGTALAHAIWNKNILLANHLIDRGANVNIAGTKASPLTRAVKFGDDALIAKLIEKGANVNLKLLDKTALSLAVELDNVSAAKILLAAGADIGSFEGGENLLVSCQSNEMRRIVKEAIAFKNSTPSQIAAIKPDAVEKVSTYMTHFPKDKHSDPLFYEKTLAAATNENNIAVVNALLAKDINVNYEVDGLPLMHLAIKLGHTDIARLLFDKGANIHAKSRNGNTVLSYAAAYSRVEIVELILNADGLDVNALDQHGQTPLYHAVCQRNLAIATLLLEKNADINIPTKQGETCLSYAVKNNFVEMAVLLIENGADIDYECTYQSVKRPLRDFPASAAIKKLMQDAKNKQQQPKIIGYLQTAYLSLSQLASDQLDSPAHLNLLIEIARQELIYQSLNCGDVDERLDATARLARAAWLSRLNSALCCVKDAINNMPSHRILLSPTALKLRNSLGNIKDGEGDVEMFGLLLTTHAALEKWGINHSKKEDFYKTMMLPLNRIHTYIPLNHSQPVYQGIYTSHAAQPSAAGLYASSASAAYASAVPGQAALAGHTPSAYPLVQQYNPAVYQTPAGQYLAHAAVQPPAAPPSYVSVSGTSLATSPYSTFATATPKSINAMFLELCAKGDVVALARFLDSNKAYPFDVNTVDVLGRSGLMLACINNQFDVVNELLLIPHLHVGMQGADGLSAADYLKKHGYQTLPPRLQPYLRGEVSAASYTNYK